MSRKRSSGSPKLSRSGRTDGRSLSFADKCTDDERQHLLVHQRALSRKFSYKPEVTSWEPEKQIEYLKTNIAVRAWGIVGDLLQALVGTEEDGHFNALLLFNTREFTDVLCMAAEDGDEGVVKILTERDLVDVKSPTFLNAFHVAAEKGHASVIKHLLRHSNRKAQKTSPRDFRNFVNGRDNPKAKNTALHLACDNEHIAVVKELLDEPFLSELDLNAVNGNGDTPLHVAVTRLNLDMVDLFCSKNKQKKLLPTKQNREGKAPYQRLWEVAKDVSNTQEVRDNAELMMQLFLRLKPVNDRRDEVYRERDYLQNVATSLLVGATLLVSVTFAAFAQMPKLPPATDFWEPGAAGFDANSDLGSRKYWYIRAIDIFRCSNAISFFMSIISIVASIRVMISRRDRVFVENEVCDLERSIRVASIALMLATAVAVVAFVSSGLANIPVAESGWSMVISHWGRHEYISLVHSTTLTTCLLGSLFVAPIVMFPLVKDYCFFMQECQRDSWSIVKLFYLLFSTALIFTVLLLVIMVVTGTGLL